MGRAACEEGAGRSRKEGGGRARVSGGGGGSGPDPAVGIEEGREAELAREGQAGAREEERAPRQPHRQGHVLPLRSRHLPSGRESDPATSSPAAVH